VNDENDNAAPVSFDYQVLVVEDEEVNRFVARGIMASIGITPDLAESGAEALAKIANHHYDLIFMDVQMPEMDGLETTALIRKRLHDDGRWHIPIIALTAFALKGDRERFLEAGMDDYMTKPLMRDNLIDMLKYWLDGRDDPKLNQDQQHIQAKSDDPLDAARFAELKQSMRSVPGGLRKVLESYQESLVRLPATMAAAINNKDIEALYRAAHSLKSNSAAAGALKLSALSADLENQAGKERTEGIETIFLQIETEIDRVTVALEAKLKDISR